VVVAAGRPTVFSVGKDPGVADLEPLLFGVVARGDEDESRRTSEEDLGVPGSRDRCLSTGRAGKGMFGGGATGTGTGRR